jgi:hypothetical protein
MRQTETTADAGELLIGAPEIAAFLGCRQKQAEHMIAQRLLPTFKLGARVCARRRTLVAWLEEQERRALDQQERGA